MGVRGRERERNRERKKREERVRADRKKGMIQQFSKMITVRFMERDSKYNIAWGKKEESEQNIGVVDEICIYYKVYRKLNKLATVGGNNVQLLLF